VADVHDPEQPALVFVELDLAFVGKPPAKLQRGRPVPCGARRSTRLDGANIRFVLQITVVRSELYFVRVRRANHITGHRRFVQNDLRE
jgi:hypothetical protein